MNTPTGRLANIRKPRQYGHDPVLFLDNLPVDSTATIEVLTVAEVAKLLKISVSGVRRLQQGRQIPFIKIGGSIRFLKSDVVCLVNKSRVEAIGQ